MGRQIWMVFFGEPRHGAAAHAEESPAVITVPLMILAALSVLGGALNLPYIHTFGHWLEHTIELVEHEVHVAAWLEQSFGGLNIYVAAISTVAALIAIYISWLLYGRKPLAQGQPDPLKKRLGFIFTGMENKWFIDEAYWFAIVERYVDVSRFIADKIDWEFWHDWVHDTVIAGGYNLISKTILNETADQKVIDGIANGLAHYTNAFSAWLRRIQNGFVRSYALSVLVGVVVILGYLLLK
jgi:NADH-quinone oxidoreductase subunit L